MTTPDDAGADREMIGDDEVIIDLSGTDLMSLASMSDAALERALKWILSSAEDPHGAVSAFQQSL